jgi:hypothetical protein
MDSLYAFKCKCFRNTRHTVTLEYHCKSLFQTPSTVQLSVNVRLYYMASVVAKCFDKFYMAMYFCSIFLLYLLMCLSHALFK